MRNILPSLRNNFLTTAPDWHTKYHPAAFRPLFPRAASDYLLAAKGNSLELLTSFNGSEGASSMITRRAAIAMLPAGFVAGSSFFSLASAQTPQRAAINPQPDAGRKLIQKIEPWKG